MLKNDRVNLVIALLIAIGLWVYVLGDVNPQDKVTIKNVPITFLNENTLEDEELVLLSVSDSVINVTVSGQRSDTKNVNISDIKVYADLEGYNEGEHTIRLRVVGPDNVEISETSKQKITVIIDELVTEKKPVSTTLTGNTNDDSEPYIVQVSKEEVNVTGAKSLVDSVVKLTAPLDASKVGDNLKAFDVKLTPVDANGNTVSGVSLGNNSVSISAVLLNKKTVNLDVPVIGQNGGGADRTVTVPKTITIKGTDAALSDISYITAEPINVANIYEDTLVPILPILPDGIELAANSQNLTAQVVVKGMESVTFEYDKNAVELNGVPDDVKVTISDVTIKLVVTGRESIISALKEDDFHFSVDISDLEPGTHKVSLDCKYDKSISEVDYTPQEIEVNIEG